MDILMVTNGNKMSAKTWCSCFILFVVVNNKDLVSGEFAVTPKNTCGMVGDSSELQCSLSEDIFQIWKGPLDNVISQNDDIEEMYAGKYSIVGKYNLHISNVAFVDAGTYKCIDSSDFGTPFSTEVIVIENSQRITSNVTSDLILENEVIRYTCEVRYAGNIVPSMEWTITSSDKMILHTTVNMPGLAQTYIVRQGNVMDNGQSFMCRTFFEKPSINNGNAASNAPNCTMETVSGLLTVHYSPRDTNITFLNHTVLEPGASVHVGDILICKTYCNPAVTAYEWTTISNNQNTALGQSQSFTLRMEHTDIQVLTCTVINYMGRQSNTEGKDSATVYLKVIDTTDQPTSNRITTEIPKGKGSNGGLIGGTVIGVLGFACMAVAIAAIVHKIRNGKKKKKEEREKKDNTYEKTDPPKEVAPAYEQLQVSGNQRIEKQEEQQRAIYTQTEEITKSQRVIRTKKMEFHGYKLEELPSLSDSVNVRVMGIPKKPTTSIKYSDP